jgi:hypothetical protein
MTRNIRETYLLLTVLAFLLFPEPGKTDVEGRSCDSDQTAMLIEYGDLITCSIDPIGDIDVFPFRGSAGEVITVRLNPQSGGSPCLALYDPDGNLLSSNCPLGIVALTVRLPKTGIYTIQVTVWNYATMTYALSLERIAPPSPSATLIGYGQHLTNEISPVGDVDLIYFNGTGNDSVTVLLTPQGGGGSPCIALYDPDGNLLGSNCPLGIAGLSVRLPKTGTYTIQATVWNYATMSYAIDLQCVGNCASLPFSAVKTFNIEATGEHLYVNGESLRDCPSLPFPTVNIFSVEVIGKHLYVNGENFKDGAQVEFNGDTIKTSNEEDFSRRLKCKKAGKRIHRGQAVLLVVRNPDGTKSQPFLYTRPTSEFSIE